MTRTEYMIRSSLGELDGTEMSLTERMERVETRLKRIEAELYESP